MTTESELKVLRNEALRRASERQRELRAAGKLVRLDPIEKARRDPKSKSKAIVAKCWDCNGGDADPNPRQRIRDCPCEDCPLYPVRPWQGLSGPLSEPDPDTEGNDDA